jgi:hypothetical protein
MASDQAVTKAFNDLITGMMPEIEVQLRERLLPVFLAGVSLGQEQSQNEIAQNQNVIAQVLRAIESVRPSVGVTDTPVAAPADAKRPAARANGGYSGITDAVRKTLSTIGRGPAGINSEKMLQYIHGPLGRSDITAQQIRSSLKLLTENSEADRCDRGCYKAGPKLVVPNGVVTAPLFLASTGATSAMQ